MGNWEILNLISEKKLYKFTPIFSNLPLHFSIHPLASSFPFQPVKIQTTYCSMTPSLGQSIYNVPKFFQKTNMSYTLVFTYKCTFQKVRNASFADNFGYVLPGWSLLQRSVFANQRRIEDCCNIQDGALCDNSWRLLAVNYYHKALHLGCCSSPISASANYQYSSSQKIF